MEASPVPPYPSLSADDLLAGRHRVDPAVLAQLRGKNTLDDRCLTCGYDGPLIWERTIKPWWGSWWIWVPMILTGIGTVFVIGAALTINSATWQVLRCPNCGTECRKNLGALPLGRK